MISPFVSCFYATKLKAVNRQRCTVTEGVFKKGRLLWSWWREVTYFIYSGRLLCVDSLSAQSLRCWIWCSLRQPPPACLKVSASAKRGRDAFHDKEQPNTKKPPAAQHNSDLNPQRTPHKQCVGRTSVKSDVRSELEAHTESEL